MREAIISGLYWLLNITIVVAALFYAFQLWGQKHRVGYGLCLLASGIVWHIGRGIYTFTNGWCEKLVASDGFLSMANKCIPSLAYDVIWAQIAIFVGLFILLATLVKRQLSQQS